MPLLTGIGFLAQCRAAGGQADIQPLRSAALAWTGEIIDWVGSQSEIPSHLREQETLDAGGRMVVPGLIDCHTHLAFAGWRADEFEARILGRSYLDIARAGGGIASTVRRTREASEDQLFERAGRFLAEMRALGVCTAECKSGYGLTLADELKILSVYDRLARTQPVRIVPTFLGAHVVPPGTPREDYLQDICEAMIPEVSRRRLARFCDVFLEETAFTAPETRRIAAAARRHHLGLKLHADQLSGGGGAELAAELGAVSADHLEQISPPGIAAMARTGVVAVSLPLASLYLGVSPLPARRLIEAGVPVAVATDFNPGSAPSYHLPLALLLACLEQRMTPSEALKGATLYAARALSLEDRLGSLEPGKLADFTLLNAADPAQWLSHFQPNACHATTISGQFGVGPE